MLSYQLDAHGAPLAARRSDAPEPRGDEVVVRVLAAGVCHSDLHLADGFFDLGGDRRLDLTKGRALPLTLGHEIAGEVVAVGSSAAGVRVGDGRVIYPWVGCGDCPICARGDEHLCARPRPLGVTLDGGFADHVLVPHARYLFDHGDVSPTLACTYACSGLTALGALRKVAGPLSAGGHLLVIGIGGVGFAALSLARAVLGDVVDIVAADVDPERLERARAAGASETIDTTAPDAVKQVKRLTGGGAIAAIDFAGGRRSATFGMSALGAGGTLIVVGLLGGSLGVSLPLLPLKQLTIRGSYVGSLLEMDQLMRLVRAGRVPPLPIDRRPLEAAQSAMDDLRAGRVVGRVVLEP